MLVKVKDWVRKADRQEWTERLNLFQTVGWCVGISIWIPSLLLWTVILLSQM